MDFLALSQNGKAAIAYTSKLKWANFPIYDDENKLPLNKNELYTIVNSMAGKELERRRKVGATWMIIFKN